MILTTIIVFVAVLALLVLAHEFGHFISARKFGVDCDEFGFGFPPRIFGFQKNKQGRRFIWGDRELTEDDKKLGTVYSLNWIPLGGFVKIKGESGDKRQDKTSFSARPIWQRAVMLSAGVIMNVLLAMVLITLSSLGGVPTMVEPGVTAPENSFIQVLSVNPDSPAQAADVKVGDTIISIDGQKFKDVASVSAYVGDKAGQKLNYEFRRGKNNLNKEIVPKVIPEAKQGAIGVTIALVSVVEYPWYQAIWEGIKETFLSLWAIILGFIGLFASLFRGQGGGAAVSGPVGIANMTGQVYNLGWVYLLRFTGILSLNLAVLNILPIPALDGGRLAFLAAEKIRGKPMNEKAEAIIHNIFFFVIIALVAVVTWKDIAGLGCITCVFSNLF